MRDLFIVHTQYLVLTFQNHDSSIYLPNEQSAPLKSRWFSYVVRKEIIHSFFCFVWHVLVLSLIDALMGAKEKKKIFHFLDRLNWTLFQFNWLNQIWFCILLILFFAAQMAVQTTIVKSPFIHQWIISSEINATKNNSYPVKVNATYIILNLDKTIISKFSS